MKKSELSFKCVVPRASKIIDIMTLLAEAGIKDNGLFTKLKNELNNKHLFMSVSTRDSLIFGICAKPAIFCSWSEPLMSYEDALKLIKSVEPDAPEFDMKPFDRVLTRNLENVWSADFFDLLSGDEIDLVACQAKECIKYEGNEKYHGTTDTPPGWWECENGKPVWRTK